MIRLICYVLMAIGGLIASLSGLCAARTIFAILIRPVVQRPGEPDRLPSAVVPEGLDYERTFRVLISQFLDRFNFGIGTVKRSCVHFVQPDGAIIPFDTYNTFYRPGVAGNAALRRGRGEG